MSVNNIYFDKEELAMLKYGKTKEELARYLVKYIRDNNIEFPFRNDSYEDAWDDFNALVNYPCVGLIKVDKSKAVTRYKYNVPFSGYIFSESQKYLACSNYFHEKARMSSTHEHHRVSPIDIWNRDNSLYAAMKSFVTLKVPLVSTATFRKTIQLKYYIASQFKVTSAKAIYQALNAERVFDISMGWGDRLAGFWSLPNTKEYWGSDPNTSVYNNYFKQAELYAKINGKKGYHFYNEPAEDLLASKDDKGNYIIPSNYFDTVFTSPPYFCCERYGEFDDNTSNDKQCWHRYGGDPVAWLKKFLFPVILHSNRILKPGGHLALNIADVSFGTCHVWHLCNPMCDFITKYVPDLEFKCLWGMEMSKRPNSKRILENGEHLDNIQDAIFYEPIFVWQKRGK